MIAGYVLLVLKLTEIPSIPWITILMVVLAELAANVVFRLVAGK